MSPIPAAGRLDTMKIMNRRTVLVATTLGALLAVAAPGTVAAAAPAARTQSPAATARAPSPAAAAGDRRGDPVCRPGTLDPAPSSRR